MFLTRLAEGGCVIRTLPRRPALFGGRETDPPLCACCRRFLLPRMPPTSMQQTPRRPCQPRAPTTDPPLTLTSPAQGRKRRKARRRYRIRWRTAVRIFTFVREALRRPGRRIACRGRSRRRRPGVLRPLVSSGLPFRSRTSRSSTGVWHTCARRSGERSPRPPRDPEDPSPVMTQHLAVLFRQDSVMVSLSPRWRRANVQGTA